MRRLVHLHFGAAMTLAALGYSAGAPAGLAAQERVDSAQAAPPASGLPFFLTLGLGYGQRSDPCAFCTSPDNTDSFTGHLSLGKYLGEGFGIGLDASVWRRAHPGPIVAAEGETEPTATPLVNQLGNLSVTLSWQTWHVFVRGGAGIAIGSQGMEDTTVGRESTVISASGKGIGYTLGGGVTVPVHTLVSLALFANWNAGSYDLTTLHGVLQRDAEHRYLEVGFGASLR